MGYPRLLTRLTGYAMTILLFPALAGAAPPAGSVIGNQASATYTDASGTTRTVTSNTVSTVVSQVASVSMASNGSKTISPAGTVYFPHTVTNTGNGIDTFNLGAADQAGDDFNFASLTFYADGNGDGVPDNATPITATAAIASGASYSFVVGAVLPGGVVAGNVGNFTVTATSVFDGTRTSSNTDTATVTGNAVINMTKSININAGASPSGPYTYTITYTNTGNSTAGNVTFTDSAPAGMSIVTNSGRWSLSGALNLTDAADGTIGSAPDTIDYSVSAGVVTVVLNRILPGQSASFSFDVNISAGLAPGVINNTGSYTYDDDNDGGITPVVGPFNTNTVAFTVQQTAAVSVSTPAAVASADQGATFSFTNTVTNSGNGSDSFDMNTAASGFPAGTTFQFYQADGVTPLLDTNGNGIPDTGNIAAAGTYNVVTQVTLPPAATGGPFTVNIAATSFFDNAVSAAGIDTLTTITAATVNVDDTAPAVNNGVGNTTGPMINVTNPGTTVTFAVFVNNSGGIGDTYDLAVGGLPAGWSALYKNSGGAVITNTGLIASGGAKAVNVEVTVPGGFASGNVSLTFTATSPATAASDSFPAQVTVNTVNDVQNTPNNTGQVFSGSTVTYSHTISNNSNVAETINLSTTNDQPGWSAAIFQDDGDGVLDAGDTSVTSLNLAVGASQLVFVKVFAPSGVAAGVINTTTFSAAGAGNTATTTDSTTVISGNVQLLKEQALDAACDGTADTAFGIGNVNANPGACIMYRITATNVGTVNATSVLVNDSTPPFTVYHLLGGAAATTIGTITTAPAHLTAGTITATVGTLAPGASAVITFKVRIEP